MFCVDDSNNSRIQKFTSDGTFITKRDSESSGYKLFINLRDVAIDSSGNAYLADGKNNRVQVFAPSK